MRQDHPRHPSADVPSSLSSPLSPPSSISPPAPGRRQWLLRALPLIGAGATLGAGLGAAWLFHAGKPDNAAPLAAFMKASQALTGKTALDRDVGLRIFKALQTQVPDFSLRIQQLAAALDAGPTGFPLPAANMSALPAASAASATPASPADPRQALAALILRSWYLGLADGIVVADRQALMQTAVADVLPVRGYCGGAPGFWAEKPLESQA